MAGVFISFIHEEQRIAEGLKKLLDMRIGAVSLANQTNREQRRPGSVFLSSDRSQLRPGELWVERLRAELAEATVLISLLSPESVRRPWVNFEAGAAWLAGKAIIPACFGGLRKEDVPRPYSDFQVVELETEYRVLAAAVLHWLEWKDTKPKFADPIANLFATDLLSALAEYKSR